MPQRTAPSLPRLPDRLRICADVVGDGRCDRRPYWEPEAQEQPDCELVGTLRSRVHPEQDRKGDEEPEDCPSA